MQDPMVLVTHAASRRVRHMRIATVAAIACVAFVAAVSFGYQNSSAAVLAAGDVTLCTDINYGGVCKVIGPGRCACTALMHHLQSS